MLGAADGYAHALVHLRVALIAPICGPHAPGVHPQHTRKLAARAAKLRPLREMERWLLERHQETRAAYEQKLANGEQAGDQKP